MQTQACVGSDPNNSHTNTHREEKRGGLQLVRLQRPSA